jgi:1-acyl-sn-glycerol-3-phosphate acyltransferase
LNESYHTPENHPQSIFDKLSLGSSVYFCLRFVAKLFENRKLALANKLDTKAWASKSMEMLKLVEDCGGKLHIEGLENILKSKEPVVFVGNHMSTLETMVLPGLIASKREVTFVVKQSLMTHPIFGPVMCARKPIAVERKNPAVDFKKVMLDGVENLKKNISVVIFPQSHREIEFNPAHFNKMGIKLAKLAKVSIVPVAIKTDFWKNGKIIKDVGGLNRKLPIHIKFGSPISIEGSGNSEHQKVIDFITENLTNWNKLNYSK